MAEVAPVAVTVTGRAILPGRAVEQAVAAVLAGEQRAASIAVTFLDPRRMRAMNREHLDHDYVTDVISFGLLQPDGSIVGDLYLCPYVAARQARALGVSVREELVRLLVHGTLHALGWDHPVGAGRTQSPMWQRQERYVRSVA